MSINYNPDPVNESLETSIFLIHGSEGHDNDHEV